MVTPVQIRMAVAFWGLLAMLLPMTATATRGEATAPLFVTATVTAACSMSTSDDVLGAASPAAPAAGVPVWTVKVACTRGTAHTLGLSDDSPRGAMLVKQYSGPGEGVGQAFTVYVPRSRLKTKAGKYANSVTVTLTY